MSILKTLLTEESMISRYKKYLPECEFTELKGKNFENQIGFDYDGVLYSFSGNVYLNDYKTAEKELKKSIEHSVKHFELTKKRHHKVVKEIYDLTVSLYPEEKIWVMMGGGMQIQAFYGNSKGYVGTLYLSMDDEKYVPSKFTPRFHVNGKENDKYFVDNFNIDGVEFRSHDSLWGKDEKEAKKIKKIKEEDTNPLDLINNVLEMNSSLFNNPINILFHMIYSYGNGYEIVKNDKVSFIKSTTTTQEKNMMKKSNEETIKEYQKLLEESKLQYSEIKDRVKSDSYEDMLKELNVTDKEIKEILKLLKGRVKELTEEIKNLTQKPIKISNIEELNNFDFNINNPYWEHLEDMVTDYSIITKIPDNLSNDWKKVLNILNKKLKEVDKKRVEKVLSKFSTDSSEDLNLS
jgi:hypothetical protein